MTQRDPLWDKIEALERVDYDRYMQQIAAFSKDEVTRILQNWRMYRQAFLWVTETTLAGKKRPVRFVPRRWQREYEQELHGEVRARGGLTLPRRSKYDIALKSRKTGFSTDVLLENYAKAATMPHQSGMFMSYEDTTAKETASILQTAHDYNPYKPRLAKQNSDGMVFQDTKSRIGIATAGAKVVARGLDLTLIHMTEVAHYHEKVDTANFMAGLMDSLSRGTGRIVQESTPNGEDPIFWATWQQAKSGELWNPIFLSVFMDETTDWGPRHPEALQETRSDDFELTEYERALLASNQASLGHIRFLRFEKAKIGDRSMMEPTSSGIVGDERLLKQEYPVDDISCFLTSQESVFDTQMVHRHRLNIKPPMWIEQNGGLLIWERKLTGRPYVVFVDTSFGLPTSNWQAAVVLDVEKLSYVARLRVKTDLANFSERVYDLAMSYNEALLMVESNNHGEVVLDYLVRRGYPNLYIREDSTIVLGGSRRQQYGWKTDGATKPLMVAEFKELFEQGALTINDEDALGEIGSYRFLATNQLDHRRVAERYSAPKGGTDDLVICYMGALQGRHLAHAGGSQAKPVTYFEWSA